MKAEDLIQIIGADFLYRSAGLTIKSTLRLPDGEVWD